MTVTPADLRRSPVDGTTVFSPYATDVPPLGDHDYVQEEWVASGVEDGRPYATTVCVRRPRDVARFSGTVIAEPLHVHGIAPIWIYTAPYILRSGHAWVEITAQKTTLDVHVKPSNPRRYDDLHIEGPDSSDFDLDPRLGDPATAGEFWSELIRRNRASSQVLAQVAAALRAPNGPFTGWDVRDVILAGHSQTGSVTSYYIEEAHDEERLDDGSPVYDGYFPSGFPYEAFHDVDVPIVQVMSEGDVAVPDYSFRPGYGGRKYRREDSDERGDRFRLYELAGVPHMGTRQAPFDDLALVAEPARRGRGARGRRPRAAHEQPAPLRVVRDGARASGAVGGGRDGAAPGRTARGRPDRLLRQGRARQHPGRRALRSARRSALDLPREPDEARRHTDLRHRRYRRAVRRRAHCARSIADRSRYVERFDRRLDELIDEGWLLPDDADEMRREATQVEF